MGEELIHGGFCGGACWNPPQNPFSGGGTGGLSSPLCSVAQLGGGYDLMSNFGWPNEAIKGKPNMFHNSSIVCDNGPIVFPSDTLDVLGIGSSPTSAAPDWNQTILLCSKDGGNEGKDLGSILQEEVNSGLCYWMRTTNSPTAIINSNNFFNNNNNSNSCSGSSNSSGDSSTIIAEGALTTNFPMSSSASYLIQSLFDDTDDSQSFKPSHGAMSSNELVSPCSNWVTASVNTTPVQYMNTTALGNIPASLLNSLQSRPRAPIVNQKSHSCANVTPKKNNGHVRDSKSNVNVSEQPSVNKRQRIETPSPLPTFKVRKEKLGDRITALQQLVSPFGKTDTASVLHEAIEYIKFLHDQVNVLSTPYLKNGAPMQHHQQDSHVTSKEELAKQALRSRGLCLVPISSTYPVAQETPVDFWTPTFGGPTFR